MLRPGQPRRPIKARAETVATSGMFRGALTSRRCLVPADAFYEWKAMADGKQPYAIARTDGAPLACAGLWEGWRGPDGETLRTFAIITTAANADMVRLHERMPVILEPAAWPAWLGEANGTPADLLRPAAVGVVRLWPVSRAVKACGTMGRRCWTRSTIRTRHRQATRRRGRSRLRALSGSVRYRWCLQ